MSKTSPTHRPSPGRDDRITIAKALGIIMVVLAHTDGHGALNRFIYEFHMPLFFICAGYFFSLKYLTREGEFVSRRFTGLYVPFVKWAVFFLLIHNLMFKVGILNEQYGNWTGGVTHPYTWHQMQQNLWNIVFSMGGYDEFLAGAFWFFRGLFVASILYLILFKILVWLSDRFSRRSFAALLGHYRLAEHTRRARGIGIAIVVLIYGMCLWKTASGLKIITLVQGGYRDLMGCFFFGIGFLLRPVLRRLPRTPVLSIALDAVLFVVVLWFSNTLTANMNWNSSLVQCLSLPLPALCGFVLTYDIACWLERMGERNPVRRFLVYCGDHTLIIFVLHICAYKIVSAFKIMYYHMDWAQMGCHMTIHDHAGEDLFWVAYTVAGVAVPLLLQYGWDRVRLGVRS